MSEKDEKSERDQYDEILNANIRLYKRVGDYMYRLSEILESIEGTEKFSYVDHSEDLGRLANELYAELCVGSHTHNSIDLAQEYRLMLARCAVFVKDMQLHLSVLADAEPPEDENIIIKG